jgi:hypothetical protein
MHKSLYYKTDVEQIAQVLRWLNEASAKERRLRPILSKDQPKWFRAMDALHRSDPRMKVETLVDELNHRQELQRGPRRWRGIGKALLEQINNDLMKCWMFPQLKELSRRTDRVVWSAVPEVHGKKERAYREMVSVILSLDPQLLSGVRRCQCGEWFHAAHGKRKFHSDLCRNRMHYANLSPRSKAHRQAAGKKYMQRYRAIERAKDLRAKSRALELRGKMQEAADLITKALELEAKAKALAKRRR